MCLAPTVRRHQMRYRLSCRHPPPATDPAGIRAQTIHPSRMRPRLPSPSRLATGGRVRSDIRFRLVSRRRAGSVRRSAGIRPAGGNRAHNGYQEYIPNQIRNVRGGVLGRHIHTYETALRVFGLLRTISNLTQQPTLSMHVPHTIRIQHSLNERLQALTSNALRRTSPHP